MKQIKIDWLALKHFKGIRALDIAFEDNTLLCGANATGKTTVFDAFTWLLFDKDSLNRSAFGIKTYTEDGDTLHGVDHTVAAGLSIEGKPLNLKKIYSEVWTKKRGAAETVFSGHTTEYFINDVPVSATEYKSRIATIISEEQFKLLTNPLYFNEILDKKQRRDIILSLEDVSDEEVISSMDPRPTELEQQLENYTVDEIKAMTKRSMKKVNEEIQELPVRIDELQGQVKDYDFKSLGLDKIELKDRIDLIGGHLSNSEAVALEVNLKVNEITRMKLRAKEIEEEVESEYRKELRKIEEAAELHQRKVRSKKSEIEEVKDNIDSLKNKLKKLETEKERKLKEYYQEYEKKPSVDTQCPTCGQDLPSAQVYVFDEVIQKFNELKSERIEEITGDGKAIAIKINSVTSEITASKGELKALETQLEALKATEVETLKPKKKKLPKEYTRLLDDIKEAELSLVWDKEDNKSEEIKKQKKALEEQLSEVEEKLSAKARNKEIKARIKELATKEKELAAMYEEKELLMYQADEFTKAKTSYISDKVNSHFGNVTFKLFDIQVNGGIQETCEVMVNGVPYSDVNNAGKINAGLDVINTLSKLYDVSAPIFVDNAEAVNKLLKTNSQLIQLIVTNDKSLRIKGETNEQ